jgi:hypothetical protein
MTQRRQFPAAFKAKVAIAAINTNPAAQALLIVLFIAFYLSAF